MRKRFKKWKSDWETKIEMEEQKRRGEWIDKEQKRKDELEKNWRNEWEKMKLEEQKRRE